MKRVSLSPRPNWQTRLEEAGMFYHTIDGKPYWNEEAAYVFSGQGIDRIEDAAQELHGMCLEHVAEVVKRGDYEGYGFPDEVKAVAEKSWHAREPHLFGRFDLGYDPRNESEGGRQIKLFEYNSDTPTGLPEASVWQYHALEDRGWPDQFNSIHEELVARWKAVMDCARPALGTGSGGQALGLVPRVHFTASAEGRHEDFGNLHYMMEVATEAGVTGVSSIDVEQLGLPSELGPEGRPSGLSRGAGADYFIDLQDRNIELLFKLYPWEWLLQEEIGWKVRRSKTRWVEPAWKLLLSTKAILPLLWKRYPKHPLLLEAHFETEAGTGTGAKLQMRKPMLGREGANISIHDPNYGTDSPVPPSRRLEQYDKHGYVLQEYFHVPKCGQHMPVLGVWVVGDKACGLGIREETGPITTNASMFVPHWFEA